MDDELVLTSLLDQAGLNELAHHLRGQCAGIVGFLELLDLLLQCLDLDILLGRVLLLLQLGLLVGPDLSHGAAPLARRLQHVGADALRHYKDKVQDQKGSTAGTYTKYECCWQISGP